MLAKSHCHRGWKGSMEVETLSTMKNALRHTVIRHKRQVLWYIWTSISKTDHMHKHSYTANYIDWQGQRRHALTSAALTCTQRTHQQDFSNCVSGYQDLAIHEIIHMPTWTLENLHASMKAWKHACQPESLTPKQLTTITERWKQLYGTTSCQVSMQSVKTWNLKTWKHVTRRH